MALYNTCNEQEAPARIRSLIGQAIGSDAALVNDKLLAELKRRCYTAYLPSGLSIWPD